MTDRQRLLAIGIGAGVGSVLGAVLFDYLALGPGPWGSGVGAFLGVFLAVFLGAALANRRRA